MRNRQATMSSRPVHLRGTCPHCLGLYAVKQDGTLYRHMIRGKYLPCPGSDAAPAGAGQGDQPDHYQRGEWE